MARARPGYQHDRRRALLQALTQLVVVGLFMLALIVLHPIIAVAYVFNPVVSLSTPLCH